MHCAAQIQKILASPLRASYDFCVGSGLYSGHVVCCSKKEKAFKGGPRAVSAPADGPSFGALLFTHVGLSDLRLSDGRLQAAGLLLVLGCRSVELLPADQQNALSAVHSLTCTWMGGFFSFCGLTTPLCLQVELTPIILSFQH